MSTSVTQSTEPSPRGNDFACNEERDSALARTIEDTLRPLADKAVVDREKRLAKAASEDDRRRILEDYENEMKTLKRLAVEQVLTAERQQGQRSRNEARPPKGLIAEQRALMDQLQRQRTNSGDSSNARQTAEGTVSVHTNADEPGRSNGPNRDPNIALQQSRSKSISRATASAMRPAIGSSQLLYGGGESLPPSESLDNDVYDEMESPYASSPSSMPSVSRRQSSTSLSSNRAKQGYWHSQYANAEPVGASRTMKLAHMSSPTASSRRNNASYQAGAPSFTHQYTAEPSPPGSRPYAQPPDASYWASEYAEDVSESPISPLEGGGRDESELQWGNSPRVRFDHPYDEYQTQRRRYPSFGSETISRHPDFKVSPRAIPVPSASTPEYSRTPDFYRQQHLSYGGGGVHCAESEERGIPIPDKSRRMHIAPHVSPEYTRQSPASSGPRRPISSKRSFTAEDFSPYPQASPNSMRGPFVSSSPVHVRRQDSAGSQGSFGSIRSQSKSRLELYAREWQTPSAYRQFPPSPQGSYTDVFDEEDADFDVQALFERREESEATYYEEQAWRRTDELKWKEEEARRRAEEADRKAELARRREEQIRRQAEEARRLEEKARESAEVARTREEEIRKKEEALRKWEQELERLEALGKIEEELRQKEEVLRRRDNAVKQQEVLELERQTMRQNEEARESRRAAVQAKQREAAERLEQLRLDKERGNAEQLQREQEEHERAKRILQERERYERERHERERQEGLERERQEREQQEREWREQQERERQGRERVERERVERERRMERERVERERAERERREKEQVEKERTERERIERERREEVQREQKAREERDRKAAERLEKLAAETLRRAEEESLNAARRREERQEEETRKAQEERDPPDVLEGPSDAWGAPEMQRFKDLEEEEKLQKARQEEEDRRIAQQLQEEEEHRAAADRRLKEELEAKRRNDILFQQEAYHRTREQDSRRQQRQDSVSSSPDTHRSPTTPSSSPSYGSTPRNIPRSSSTPSYTPADRSSSGASSSAWTNWSQGATSTTSYASTTPPNAASSPKPAAPGWTRTSHPTTPQPFATKSTKPTSPPSPNAERQRWKKMQQEEARRQAEQFAKEQERLEREQQAKAARSVRKEDVLSVFKRHTKLWDGLQNSASLEWDSFPWPSLNDVSTVDDLTPTVISTYYLNPHWSANTKERLRNEIRHWHPDRFESTLLVKVKDSDKERVKEAAGIVARTLNDLMKSNS